MPGSDDIDLRFTGDYSMAASVSLAGRAAFVGSPAGDDPGVLDLTFALEGSWATVSVRVHQDGGGVRASLLANPGGASREDVRAQLERILCLDVDGAGFADVAARDDVVAALRQRFPGVRPVLLPTPYEAAARAIIGHRLFVAQAAAVSARVGQEHGVRLVVGDRTVYAFPAPDRLADLPPVLGLSARKVDQLRALGVAAADGRFATARLRAMQREQALAHLQQLPGIGPFSAELVLLRGAGDPDAFPRTELRLHKAMATAYHLGEEPDLETLERVAARWRPYRSWVGLLLRNTTPDDIARWAIRPPIPKSAPGAVVTTAPSSN